MNCCIFESTLVFQTSAADMYIYYNFQLSCFTGGLTTFDIMIKHAEVQLIFISLVKHLVFSNISKFKHKLTQPIDDVKDASTGSSDLFSVYVLLIVTMSTIASVHFSTLWFMRATRANHIFLTAVQMLLVDQSLFSRRYRSLVAYVTH